MVQEIEEFTGQLPDAEYLSAADYAIDVAKKVEANEATRGASENTRQANEQVRNKNEYGWTDTSGVHHNGRVDNETARQTAETNRQNTFNNNESGATVYKVGTKVLLKTIDASTGTQKVVEINGKDYLQWSDDSDDDPERYTLKGKQICDGDYVYTYSNETLTKIGDLSVTMSRWGKYEYNEEGRNIDASIAEGTSSSTDTNSRWGKFNTNETARNTASSAAAKYANDQGDKAKAIYDQVKAAYDSGQLKGDKGDKGDAGIKGESGDLLFPELSYNAATGELVIKSTGFTQEELEERFQYDATTGVLTIKLSNI